MLINACIQEGLTERAEHLLFGGDSQSRSVAVSLRHPHVTAVSGGKGVPGKSFETQRGRKRHLSRSLVCCGWPGHATAVDVQMGVHLRVSGFPTYE